jgi:hypothetical protein
MSINPPVAALVRRGGEFYVALTAACILRKPAAMLIPKRASKSRPTGQWSDDDYDVFHSDRHVGRILLYPQAPQGQPWLWTITAQVPQYLHDRGYAASREQAMADFKVRWTG